MNLYEKKEEGGAVSCVSMKSNCSLRQPIEFHDKSGFSKTSVVNEDLIQCQSRCGVCNQVLADAVCGEGLSRQCASCYSDRKRSRTCPVMEPSPIEDTGDLQQDSHQSCDVLQKVKDQHKRMMKKKYESLSEGIKLQENQTLLNRIYTQLMLQGESEGVNKQHEVLHMEKTARAQHSQETPIDCNDIFKASSEPGCEEKDQIKTVLTKGIAGIGKTVSVQKFILDWAEGKANQDIDFMFVLPFRELNLIRDHQYSLHRLLLDFHPELQDLDSNTYEDCKVVFILDGLDENRIPLMLSDAQEVSDVTEILTVNVLMSKKVCDVTEISSVGVLISKLIKGELLPCALIWITSRPAAASQIPSKYINRLTEIQGFNEAQKEEYFRKRISDEHQASRIISHIRRARSLHIMCQIPIFCWISSTVLQNILKQDLSAEISHTLTEMYIHFLLIQISVSQKYEEIDSNREVLLKLSEVAFKQMMKGNWMFYEEELKESGIDVIDASVCSGICSEIFKEESVIHQSKIYCFIHLSFQEFLAAFYVVYCYLCSAKEALFDSLHNLHVRVFNKVKESENGELDLFLRFLLGISLESNQRLLQDLLTHTENSSESMKKTSLYIKNTLKNNNISTERSINLFLCLLEMKDQSLCKEIQEYLASDKHAEKLTPSQCSSITYMLQMSEEVLDELDLKKYNTTEEGRRRLIPAVINCRKALLVDSNITGQCCEIVTSALQSSMSLLRELDLSNNDLEDSGVKLISDALKSTNCLLEILRLSGCMVTEVGCCYLASALRSTSHLKELDLSYNQPGQLGVKCLSERLNDPLCTLEKLNLDHNEDIRITPGLQKYACDLTLDPNTAYTRLFLSEENTKVTYIENQPFFAYPDHSERFDKSPQLLCRESLTGRCYWEVELSGKGAFISMAYKGISRKGESDDCVFGCNEKSWTLDYSYDRFSAWHNNKSNYIPPPSPPSNRVGVYMDWSAGTLSFFSVSDTHTRTHLHTFNTTFTEPLYGGLGIYLGSSVSLVKLNKNN
ncbi:protein NLRC3-like [Pseudorasbora parva]|uniref:protein NLRC3-like n=1 Tax=Pseudorasbora parva TaxID=51549 RepID=UPI00351E8939